MASGLPMVVTDVGGNSEAIDDKINGLIVPAKDSTKLGEAILTLASDKTLRKKMGIAARTKVKKGLLGINAWNCIKGLSEELKKKFLYQ